MTKRVLLYDPPASSVEPVPILELDCVLLSVAFKALFCDFQSGKCQHQGKPFERAAQMFEV